ncbi:ABC transporter substrate-binding protein, partial [Streptomyces albidoflavus]
LAAGTPDVRFHIPDSGYVTSSDSLLVPNRARHKTNAERLIDYYYEPKVAAELAAWINFVCPVDGVKAELAKIDKEAAENPLIVPDKAMAAKSRSFRSLTSKEEARYEAAFAKLTT